VSSGLDTTQIAGRLTCCTARLDAVDQRLQLTLFRLLAKGEAVEPRQVAGEVGMEAATVVARLGRCHGVHTDDAGRVVAFQGLSVVEAPHRLRIDSHTLYAWCAWDTLFLPELIGRAAEIASTCPETGVPISLRVGPEEGPADVSPPGAILSFVLPGARLGNDTIASFCNFIHYFASRQVAERWTAERPGTFVVSIEDAFEVGRRTNATLWGDAIGRLRT
jgi:alkylmercury lyase